VLVSSTAGGLVAIAIVSLASHAVRVALAAGAMLFIGALAALVVGWCISIIGIRSGTAVLTVFVLVAIIGIAGGCYVSIRHIAPHSVTHPVAAAALLGLFPVGVTFHGDVGLMRVAIVLSAVAIAAVAAVVIRSRETPPNTSLERTCDR
jgi:hypothetical protein